jgi:hypothetical protein
VPEWVDVGWVSAATVSSAMELVANAAQRMLVIMFMGSAQLDALLACFAHLQHRGVTDTQIVELLILRAALCVDCVDCCLG